MTLGIAATVLVGLVSQTSASTIFTINPSPDTAGLSFATSVSDFTPPVPSTGGSPAILGAPDLPPGATDPNVPQVVDFGGDSSLAWAVTVGFAATFADGPGIDARVFVVQLDTTEGFDLYASAGGASFLLLGSFIPAAPVLVKSGIDIDFNGQALPAGANYLRFVAVGGVTNSSSRGLDFDAVGVVPAAAVPEPTTFAFVSTGAALCAYGRRRRVRSA
jgi:hypothetical protein